MKKSLRGISLSLCALLLLAGCSNNDGKENLKANINNGNGNIVSGLTGDAKNITLQNVYDDLRAELGNEIAAEKLIDIIAASVLSETKWQERYEAKMEEKLLALTKKSEYQINGEFSEELLVKSLSAQLFNITCGTTDPVYGPAYKDADKVFVDRYLLCDYSDYKEKVLKIDVLTELLNEKYVYDKVFADKANILTTKKARLVEYISISNGEDFSFEFISDAVDKLAADNSTVTLEDIAELWEEKLIEKLENEYAKINTSEDSTGTIMKDFTNGYMYSKEQGLRIKKQETYNGTYYDRVVITNDSKSILNTTLVERILSDNVLDQDAEKTIKIGDSYYLVSPLASNVKVSDIRITDKTNSKYYLIKVDVINSESDEDLIYDAVKVLATNKTLVSDSINYYLEQNKNNISVHDEEIYAYLKTQYKDIFVD